MTTRIELVWSHGTAELVTAAAMLISARFRSGSSWISPFAPQQWSADDPSMRTAPTHLRHLAAEFVALPFGSAELPVDAPERWRSAHASAQRPVHGFTAEEEWMIVARSESSVTFRIEPLAPNPIARVERTVRGVDGEAALEFGLTIWARSVHRTSLGLHPIFRLPEPGETLELDVTFTEGRTYPVPIDGGSSILALDSTFDSLTAVPAHNGPIDASRLPFAPTAEEVIQLADVRAPVQLRWSNGDVVVLDWTTADLQSLLVWISDGHLAGPPWNGHYRGLGLEPIASAFDFAPGTSVGTNPFQRSGYPTSVRLTPDRAFAVTYRVSAKNDMNESAISI